MNPSLPPEVVVHQLRQGVRFELARPSWGVFRWLGLLPVVFGLAFAGFAIFWMTLALQGAGRGKGAGPWMYLFPLFGVPFLLVGLGIVRRGVLIIAGHTALEADGETLRLTERAGLFRRTQKVALKQVQRITVETSSVNLPPVAGGRGLPGAALQLELANGRRIEMLRGYPAAWLEPLARELATRTGTSAARTSVDVRPAPTDSTFGGVADTSDRLEPPAGCSVRIEPAGRGISVSVPPGRLRGLTRSMFIFGLVWLTFTGGIFGAVLFSRGGPRGLGAVPVALFSLVFVGAGVVMVLGALNMARRRALILADQNNLKIGVRGLFGMRTHAWATTNIAGVQVGPGSMRVNNQPVLELQVVTRDGKAVGFFGGREVEELRWLATQLRRALGLATGTSPQA